MKWDRRDTGQQKLIKTTKDGHSKEDKKKYQSRNEVYKYRLTIRPGFSETHAE